MQAAPLKQQRLGFVFPGQGSQAVGMLKELAALFPLIKSTFAEASQALGYDLWELSQQGDPAKLAETSVTQPALLTSSVAIWRLWKEQGGISPALMAGHSLGEYSALVCAEALAFPEAVHLTRRRGELMQNAAPKGQGGMAAVIGLDDEAVIAACAQAQGAGTAGRQASAANFNAPGQVVIAGHKEALARASALCKAAGAKRVVPLAVSAPFHSSLMQPAAERFAKELAAATLRSPKIPVLQNSSLEIAEDPVRIRANLVSQIVSPVPWVEIIRRFQQRGIASIFELGPGKVLSGLNKRIEPALETLTINDPASLEAGLARTLPQSA